MRPGQVVTIRLSPKDCLSVIDLCNAINIETSKGAISFAQSVKIALASCLETMRMQGVIPERDGFEYLEMMSRYKELGRGAHGRKVEATMLINQMGDRFAPPALPAATATPIESDAHKRLDMLEALKVTAPDTFTDAMEQERITLFKQLEGIG